MINLSNTSFLNKGAIKKMITPKFGGVYVLGSLLHGKCFVPEYVGRSDSSLSTRLENWVGHYQSFRFKTSYTSITAYQDECILFHELRSIFILKNIFHPASPADSRVRCPVCGQ